MKPEDEFQEIGENMLTKAAAVECSRDEYREGPRGIISDIQTAILASREDDAQGARRRGDGG